jgi:hypothetical protein
MVGRLAKDVAGQPQAVAGEGALQSQGGDDATVIVGTTATQPHLAAGLGCAQSHATSELVDTMVQLELGRSEIVVDEAVLDPPVLTTSVEPA